MQRKRTRTKPKNRNAMTYKTADEYVSFANAIRGQSADTGYYRAINLVDNREYLETIYTTSWLSSKIVDSVAEDMTKDGINISGILEERATKLQKYITEKGIWSALTNLLKWARLYGGAIAFIAIEGQDPSSPLDPATIGPSQFIGLSVFDRHRVYPLTNDLNFYGEPIYYKVDCIDKPVHFSRVIKAIGIMLPYEMAQRNQFWGDSVLTRVLKCVKLRDEALNSAGQLIGVSFLRTAKIDGLRQVIATGGRAQENLQKMFAYMRDIQNNAGMTIMDKSDEFQTNSYSFGGLDALLSSFALEVAGACNIPVTRLYGQSPAGFSTGDSDLKTYYDSITSEQETVLRAPLSKLLEIGYRSLFGYTDELLKLDFDFDSPWRPNEIEDRAQTVSECNTVISAAAAGLISQSAAMRNLKVLGTKFNLFSTISDSDIDYAIEPTGAPALDPSLESALETLADNFKEGDNGSV